MGSSNGVGCKAYKLTLQIPLCADAKYDAP